MSRYPTVVSKLVASRDRPRSASAISRQRRARSSGGNKSKACAMHTCPSVIQQRMAADTVARPGDAAAPDGRSNRATPQGSETLSSFLSSPNEGRSLCRWATASAENLKGKRSSGTRSRTRRARSSFRRARFAAKRLRCQWHAKIVGCSAQSGIAHLARVLRPAGVETVAAACT